MKTFFQHLNKVDFLLLIFMALGHALASASFHWAIAPWIGISCGLIFLRKHRNVWALLLVYLLGLGVSLWVEKDVIPLPFSAMLPFMMVLNGVALIPYVLDMWMHPRLKGILASLAFPTAMVVLDSVLAQGPQGTWGHLGYSQFAFRPLMQLVTVTGLWGVGFIIYWFAAVMANVFTKKDWRFLNSVDAIAFSLVFTLSMGYGAYKLSQKNPKHEVTVATITMDNTSVAKSMYLASFDSLPPLPEVLQQNSPELAELMKGFGVFCENPLDPKYEAVYDEMDALLDRYLIESGKAAEKKANIITWSEGAIMNTKANEEIVKAKGREFAIAHKTYLFMPVAIFHPEKVGKDTLYIENKIWTFSPEGELVNEYFKNIPVMGIEPSFPGDGDIPVIETPYGRIAQAICYDLDFPTMMRQLGQKQADLIVVPTGDWEGISPYHTYMGITRGMENGVAMAKAVSNGLSSISDHTGRIIEANSFFDEEETHTILQTLEIGHQPTLYSQWGDWFVGMVQLILLGLIVLVLGKLVKEYWIEKRIAEK